MCIRDRLHTIQIETFFKNLFKLKITSYFLLNPNKNNTNENYNDMCNNVVLDKKLTNDDDDVENDKNNIENGNVFEEVVSESDALKINSENTDEVVECNNEMLMCVYELEREWKDNIVVELSLIHI